MFSFVRVEKGHIQEYFSEIPQGPSKAMYHESGGCQVTSIEGELADSRVVRWIPVWDATSGCLQQDAVAEASRADAQM